MLCIYITLKGYIMLLYRVGYHNYNKNYNLLPLAQAKIKQNKYLRKMFKARTNCNYL